MSPRQDQRRSFHPRVEALEIRALLSVCLVDRLTDVGEGKDFTGDLRYCIAEAQDGDSVQFAVKGTIDLTRALPYLTRSINITGPGPESLTVRHDGGGSYPAFTPNVTAGVSISGLTIAGGFSAGILVYGGSASIGNCVISQNEVGVAVEFAGVSIGNCVISENRTGITVGSFHYSSLTINNSVISLNETGFATGGPNTEVTIRNCTISDNSRGGISSGAGSWISISKSTISGNSGYGGITAWHGVEMTVTNSTISNNNSSFPSWGSAVSVATGDFSLPSTVRLVSSTIAHNTGVQVFQSAKDAPTQVEYRNTIIAGDGVRPNCDGSYGTWVSRGYNISTDDSCRLTGPGDLPGIDPLVSPLQDNGGPTLTHALLPGSPALDVGDPTGAPEWDQRGEGFPRIAGKNIDIGAYEEQGGRGPAPGAAIPPSFVSVLGIDPAALVLLETPTRRTFFGWGAGRGS